MKTIAIIQARMGSARLPGKVLLDLAGMPVLEWVLRAARAVQEIKEVWVASTWLAEDEPIWKFCAEHKIPHLAGQPDDVLSRFRDISYLSLDPLNEDCKDGGLIVRLTSDCPFLDPALISRAVKMQGSTTQLWPDGMDVQVFPSSEMARFDDPEHVVPAWYETRQVPGPANLRRVRVSLDTKADLVLLRSIAEHLPSHRPPHWYETLEALRKLKEAA